MRFPFSIVTTESLPNAQYGWSRSPTEVGRGDLAHPTDKGKMFQFSAAVGCAARTVRSPRDQADWLGQITVERREQGAMAGCLCWLVELVLVLLIIVGHWMDTRWSWFLGYISSSWQSAVSFWIHKKINREVYVSCCALIAENIVRKSIMVGWRMTQYILTQAKTTAATTMTSVQTSMIER